MIDEKEQKIRTARSRKCATKLVYDELLDTNIQQNTIYERRLRWKRIGLNHDQAMEKARQQNFRCAICDVRFGKRPTIFPYFDHDHKTNIARGVLCLRCNTMLGHAEDDIEFFKKMIAYLKKHKSVE